LLVVIVVLQTEQLIQANNQRLNLNLNCKGWTVMLTEFLAWWTLGPQQFVLDNFVAPATL
jgi:hypothetical protein